MKRIRSTQKIALIVFGVFLCTVLLEAGLRLGGYIFLARQDQRNRISIRKKGAYRIMCLGESTTASGGKDSFPRQLERILNQRDTGIAFSVINKGVPYIDTHVIVSQLQGNLARYEPDMLITMMGINDRSDTVPYEDMRPEGTTRSLTSFRTYKLARLLGLHIVNKASQIGGKEEEDGITFSPSELRVINDLGEQEQILRRATEIDPKDERAYFELARWYGDQGRYGEAAEVFREATEIAGERAYVEWGWYYIEHGQYDRAASILEVAVETGEYDSAKDIFREAIELDPRNASAYFAMGWWHKDQGEPEKAEEMFQRATRIDPENSRAYAELGWWYMDQGRYDEGKGLFGRAIEIDPRNARAYFGLGWWHKNQGDHDKGEEMLRTAGQISPRDDAAYVGLGWWYLHEGKYEEAEEMFRRATRLRLEYFNPMTRRNYQRLRQVVMKKGIRLVCVQYPLRSVEVLKKMVDNKEGIIFVDNERSFKTALKYARYDEYFTDKFAGDLGHCTPKGNRLLATTIADVILKECFSGPSPAQAQAP